MVQLVLYETFNTRLAVVDNKLVEQCLVSGQWVTAEIIDPLFKLKD